MVLIMPGHTPGTAATLYTERIRTVPIEPGAPLFVGSGSGKEGEFAGVYWMVGVSAGFHGSSRCHSDRSLFPLELLQRRHAGTTFSTQCPPPRLTGIT